MSPIVSVIVPAYNAENTLTETLVTIINQSESRIEVIVVDDCSTDTTAEIVNRFSQADSRVILVTTRERSGGPARPRNVGLSIAKGKWVAFCDSDDMWHPLKLEVQLATASEEDATLICSKCEIVSGKLSGTRFADLPEVLRCVFISRYQMLIKNRVATSTVLVSKSVIDQNGFFDESNKLIAVEDYEYWLRCLERKRARVVFIDLPLCLYRRQAGSLSANKFKMFVKVFCVLNQRILVKNRYFRYIAAFALMFSYVVVSVSIRVKERFSR